MAGYINPERLLALHPDAPQLQAIERRIERARRFPAPLALHPLTPPEPLILSAPETRGEAPTPSRSVDGERVRTSISEDFEIRRRGRPEEEEQRYRRALERLRRRFVELRLEPRPSEDSEDLEAALRNARRFSELEEQLRSLKERPEDRLFYTPAQLSRRRELYRITQQELEALRQTEAARLERSLDPTVNRPRSQLNQERQIPAEELARAAQARDARRREALELLAQLERSTLEMELHRELPPMSVTQGAPEPVALPAEELVTDREAASEKVSRSNAGKVPPPSKAAFASAAASLAELGKLREELRQRLLEEVRAAAASAARHQGIDPTFSAGAAPDRTAQVAPEVTRLLSGTVRSGAK